MTPTAANESRRRRGFTLVELLVVIVIISLLLGLLIPAINAAIKTARGAAVQAEISQLAQALADFKNKFGDYPPSRIVLNESGAVYPSSGTVSSSTYNDVSVGLLYQRTITAFRKFWPRVTLNNGSPLFTASPPSVWYDFNGDGTPGNQGGTLDTPIFLSGHQALVFFLGGIPQPDPTGLRFLGVTGFGKSPTNPFSNNILNQNKMYNGNRNPPLFEFNAARLQATAAYSMPGYLDSLSSSTLIPPQNFYAYFSTNNGAGYDPNDVNTNEPDPSGTTLATALTFTTSFPVYKPSGTLVSPGVTTSPSPNPYTTGSSFGTTVSYLNPQSFQIISPGIDGFYGVGGAYDPNSTTASLPTENVGGKYPNSNSSDPTLRTLESDNLTNFHNGKLQ